MEAGCEISAARQCELLGLARSTLYYKPAERSAEELARERELKRAIDEIHCEHPCFGTRGISAMLARKELFAGRDLVRRLMLEMGIEALYQKPRKHLSAPGSEHRVWPYLLRGVAIVRVLQVWATDITYIRTAQGDVFLCAVLDWFSRKVIAWRLSRTLEADFCVAALRDALTKGRPEIFNTDQGCQFTSAAFTGVLQEANVRISMDGRGRCFDNIFTERLWRTVKREDVYIRGYEDFDEAEAGLGEYFKKYNSRRVHKSLRYRTPDEVHAEGLAKIEAEKRAEK